MAKLSAPERPANDASEDAIAAVLQAERDASQAIERTRIEGNEIVERARSDARRVAERNERRIRVVVTAFERELAERLADIDTEAAAVARPHQLSANELAKLDQAVRALAQELTGVRP